MPYSNISAAFNPGDMNEIKGHITQIKNKMPWLVNLTPEERQSLSKMSDKRLAFVTKALEYAASNPTLVPGYAPLSEGQKDFKLNNDLREVLESLGQLTESVLETQMAVSAEAYDFGRVFYSSVQEAAKRNVPGTDAIADDLGELFDGQGTEEPETPNP